VRAQFLARDRERLRIALGATSTPTITSTLTASGTYGAAFSYNITATNLPTSYGATGLPSGLSLNTGTGAITGAAAQTGNFNVGLAAGTTATSFTVRQAAPGQAATVPLTVVDGCGEWPCIEETNAGVACPPHPYGQEVTMRDYTVVVTETIQRVVHVRVRDGQTSTRERAKRYALEVIGRGNHNETRLVKSSVRIEETGSQNEIW